MAGFDHPVSPYYLRRGATNVLDRMGDAPAPDTIAYRKARACPTTVGASDKKKAQYERS